MYRSGMRFNSERHIAQQNAYILENIAYAQVQRAHDRFLRSENLFTANALTKASDNYRRIVEQHEAMGL